MYKVYYYMSGGTHVSCRTFPNLAEATEFSISLPIESVLEIKLVPDNQNKRENRT